MGAVVWPSNVRVKVPPVAPLIATALQTSTGTSLSVSAYMIAVALISLIAVWAMPETLGRDVSR